MNLSDINIYRILLKNSLKMLYNYLLKTNQIFSLISRKSQKNLSKQLKYISLVVCFFWITLSILFQIFFHDVGSGSGSGASNLFVIAIIFFYFIFCTADPMKKNIRMFFLQLNVDLLKKRKLLVVLESFIPIIVFFLFILIFSPYTFMQIVLNGAEGFGFIIRLHLLMLYISLIVTGFKVILLTLEESFKFRGLNIFNQILILLLLYITTRLLDRILSYLFEFGNSLLNGKHGSYVLKQINAMKINLYSYVPSINIIIFCLIFTVFLVFVASFLLLKTLRTDQTYKIPRLRFEVVENNYFILFKEFNRRWGFINLEFLMYTIILLAMLMSKDYFKLHLFTIFSVLKFLNLSLFLNKEIENNLYFFYINKTKIWKVSVLFNIYLFPRMFLSILWAAAFNLISIDFTTVFYMIFSMIGLYAGITVYIFLFYRIVYYLNQNIADKLSTILTNILVAIVIGSINILLLYLD
ncbi:hypothetical protein VSK91_09170 [Bacillus swezeyi]|uniref:hypothetical protein n=1 Tax=Bacillus swezeyi TaxID=1925020 RepID=UPI0039C72A35